LLAAFAHNQVLRSLWTQPAGSPDEVATANEGCPFRPRCVRAQSRCAEEHPALRDLSSGHRARCHFPVERTV
jgi:oligopeptide/dipeptide ABC transporter ATP-binding protein